MPFALYLDEDIMRHSLTSALRAAGVDVLTPLESQTTGTSDEEQLAFATTAGRAILTLNAADFGRLYGSWAVEERAHGGILIVTSKDFQVGMLRDKLLRLQSTRTADTMRNELLYLNTDPGQYIV